MIYHQDSTASLAPHVDTTVNNHLSREVWSENLIIATFHTLLKLSVHLLLGPVTCVESNCRANVPIPTHGVVGLTGKKGRNRETDQNTD